MTKLQRTLPRWFMCMGLMMAALPAAPAGAVEAADPKTMLLEKAKAQLPADWQVRVSKRDQALVVFVTPPTSEAFTLLYDTNSSMELVQKLCPKRDEEVWAAVGPDTDIAVQPTILGKTGLRTSCKAVLAEKPGS